MNEATMSNTILMWYVQTYFKHKAENESSRNYADSYKVARPGIITQPLTCSCDAAPSLDDWAGPGQRLTSSLGNEDILQKKQL